MSPRKSTKLTPKQRRARLEQAQEQLNSAVEKLTTSEGWRTLISSRAWLRHYSANNVMRILQQCPHARDVRAFRAWLNAGRPVRKGERGLRILAPMRYRAEDEETEPEREDAVGVRRYEVRGFTVTTVFDISQTEGDPAPEPDGVVPQELRGVAPDQLWDQVAAMITERGYTLERGDCGDAYGYVHYSTRTVYVRGDVDPAQAVKTLTHERPHPVRALHPGRAHPPTRGGRSGVRGVRRQFCDGAGHLGLLRALHRRLGRRQRRGTRCCDPGHGSGRPDHRPPDRACRTGLTTEGRGAHTRAPFSPMRTEETTVALLTVDVFALPNDSDTPLTTDQQFTVYTRFSTALTMLPEHSQVTVISCDVTPYETGALVQLLTVATSADEVADAVAERLETAMATDRAFFAGWELAAGDVAVWCSDN